MNFRNLPQKLIHTLREYKRVITVTRKPTIEELSRMSKISALGILLIGLIGFIIQVIFKGIVG